MTVHPRNQVTGWLVAAVPELTDAVLAHGDDLTVKVNEAIERGQAAWPALRVDDRAMVAAIAGALRHADDPRAAIDELFADDLHLAQACAANVPGALDAFDATCNVALVGSLRAMGLAHDRIDELVQEVRTKLFVAAAGAPKIATYSGRAPLRSWVRTIATRAAVDRLRRTEIASNDDDALAAVADPADGPELEHFRRTYHAEFKLAFEEALASLEVRERNVLRHHFVDALTVEEIGALYGVHKTTAFRWMDAARIALAKRTRNNFQNKVRAAPAELDSILRLLQSHIELSLSRVLAT